MKSNFIYMSFVLAALSLGSCKKDFLDQKPYASVPVGTAITTEAEMQAAVNGMYASLRNTDGFGRNIPVLGDLMADNIYVSGQNSGRYLVQNAYTTTVATAEPAGIWGALYASILRANTVINTNLPETAVTKQLKGEALAVRALCHFELVKHFAQPFTVAPNGPGVPIVTAFDQNSSPSRNTTAEVYAQINKDLDAAFTNLTVAKNSSYINKYAAKALQARVYLTMGDYANAKTAALEVKNNGGYSLVSSANYVNYWANPIPRTDKVETIFEISLDMVNNNGTNALAYIFDQAGYGDQLATADLYNKYATGDVRKGVIKVGTRGTADPVAYIVNKYPNSSSTTDRDEVKVMRYAEVLLILAEAQARTADPAAILTLNEVATARGAAPYVSVGDALIEDILLERRKELAFEGQRYWDLVRLNRDIVRTAQHPASARNIAVGDYRRILPIPQGERDANPNIAQNPTY